MKELSIEEKARAYDEALEKFDVILNLNTVKESGTIFADDVKKIFPELKESEDERIREVLIGYFKKYKVQEACGVKTFYGIPTNNIIAWLEKQGVQKKSYDTCDSSIIDNKKSPYSEKRDFGYFEVNPSDDVKLKFSVGDWVVFNNKHQSIYQVEKIEDGYYILRHIHGGTFRVCVLHDESLRLWTIQDAKDGDVLQLGNVTAIFKEFISINDCKCYCSVCNGEFEIPSQDDYDNIYGCHNAIPATKEQRDLLFQNMNEAGYEWDAENKELKKIDMQELVEHKPAWSEEDRSNLNWVINVWNRLRRGGDAQTTPTQMEYLEEWLKSIKERVLPQPKQEWSEEDKIILNGCIHAFEKLSEEANDEDPQVAKDLRFCYRKYVNWLKSLN